MTDPIIKVRPLGIAQAVKNLETLSQGLQSNITRAAVRRATNVIGRAIKATTYSAGRKQITGLLLRSQSVAVSKKGEIITGSVRMRDVNITSNSRVARLVRKHRSVKAGTTKTRAFYWWFLEKGTQRIKARPWVIPAFDATSATAIDAFAETLRNRVDAETAKLPKGVK
jgi:HK97 gp10 family phage protein